MDTAFFLAALGFLVVGVIIFFMWLKIERLEAFFDRFQADHMLKHRVVRDEELQRAQAVAATVESLQGMRYAIIQVQHAMSKALQGKAQFEVGRVITCSQPCPPYESAGLNRREQDELVGRLGVHLDHLQSNLGKERTVLVMHPAHFIPTNGLMLPDPRIKVIAGTVPELVSPEPPDLEAIAASLRTE